MQKPVPAFRRFARSNPRRLLLAGFIHIVACVSQLSGAQSEASIDPAALDKWQVRSSSINFIRRIVSGPKGYVAVGIEGTILTSAEGAVWSRRSSGVGDRPVRISFCRGWHSTGKLSLWWDSEERF